MALGNMVMLCTGFGLGCAPNEYRCTVDSHCSTSRVVGYCEFSGYCSFDDDACESGRRYAEASATLSNQCVAVGVGESAGGSSTSGPEGPGSAGTSGDGSAPIPEGPGTTASDQPSTSSSTGPDEGDESSNVEPGAWVFVDDDLEDFESGELDAVRWRDGAVELSGEANGGVLTSSVFDTGSNDVQWLAISWEPEAPYAKPIVSPEIVESGYERGALDLPELLVLFHLDDGDFSDASGGAHDLGVAAGHPSSIQGMFGTAVHLDDSTYLSTAQETSAFSFGDGPFTWSAWVRSTSQCEGSSNGSNQVYVGIEEPSGPALTHLWLGCMHADNAACPSGETTSRFGGTMTASQSNPSGIFCDGSTVVDDAWHHLAVVKTGHNSGSLTMYFDGERKHAVPSNSTDPFDFSAQPGAAFTLGAFRGGNYQASVSLDEVAVMRTALSDEDVRSLYLRGRLRLDFRIRTCTKSDCDGSPFVGPDGTTESVFVDPPDGAGPPFALSLLGQTGRYFQYQARFAGTSGETPRIRSVTVTAQAE